MKEEQFGHLQGVLRSVPRTFSKKDSLEHVLDFFYRNPDFNTAVVQDSRERVVGVISRNSVLEFLAKKAEPGCSIEPLIDHNYQSVQVKDLAADSTLGSIESSPDDLLVVDDKGKYLSLASWHDIYSLLREKLQVLTRTYDAVLNSTYEGIIAIDSEGKVTVFNEAAGRMLDRDPRECLGKHVKEVIPSTRLVEVMNSVKAELRQKFEIENKTFLANRAPIILGGRVMGAISVFQDITVEEELLSELADIKQLMNILQLILDNAYLGIVFVDSNGIIQFMNRMYEDLLEINPGTAIGKHITEYFPDSRLPLVIKSGKPELGWKYNFRGRTLVLNRIPIRKGNEVVGAITQCIFKDISELKHLVGKLDLLERKVKFYRKELTHLLAAKYSLKDIQGNSEAILNLKKLTRLYARTDSPVLIMGDTGTGKELFAHAIHSSSNRSKGPFVCLNSASLPKELLESELFGYAPGAFTGAHHKGKIGKIELAESGTLFLDEIGDLPLSAQAKLLRVLEEKRIERIGDVHPIDVDFRLVAATNRNLEQMVKEGGFRDDLYYRLGTMTLFMPTLKSRSGDIPLLVHHYMEQHAGRPTKISVRALNALMKYGWPGNVRELRNVIERAVTLLDEDDTIDINHLPSHVMRGASPRRSDVELSELALKGVVWEQEERTIRAALDHCKGKKVHAARMLGISRSVLYSKMKRYGISH
jgi:PAS domain S-box-containing protein